MHVQSFVESQVGQAHAQSGAVPSPTPNTDEGQEQEGNEEDTAFTLL